ncbi:MULTISPECIES: hypothetical protein [Microvirga]|uniref:hypothetical protein n=1 Tax=Microvirga TaxID=186650 RepID=UPI0021C650E0|nr:MULTISPECIES: hypothetical protein [unclassified Microvirga]
MIRILLPALLAFGLSVQPGQSVEVSSPPTPAADNPVRIEDLGIVLPSPIVVPSKPAKPKVEHPAPLTEEEKKAKELASYQSWCGGPRDLAQCTDAIIYLDREIRRRQTIVERTKNPNAMGNLGLSIAGCPEYCRMRYFPSDTPQECESTISTFKHMARTKPYLLKSDFRKSLLESCGKF